MLIRRRDQVRAAAEVWLAEARGREHTAEERLLFDALGVVPEAASVTLAMLRRVGRGTQDIVCSECRGVIMDGAGFGDRVVCLQCLTAAQRELSRL